MVKLINESNGSNKPSIDWSKVTNGIDNKLRHALSRTYRLTKDFNLGDADEAYKWYIEDSSLANLVEEGFWVDENGDLVIPAGTEFCWYFTPKDDGRFLYLNFLNVPELGGDTLQLWEDRYYNDDDWAYEIMSYATPID